MGQLTRKYSFAVKGMSQSHTEMKVKLELDLGLAYFRCCHKVTKSAEISLFIMKIKSNKKEHKEKR